MKKFMITLSLFLFLVILIKGTKIKAEESNTDYQTYVEIVMSSGKLLKNYKKEELDSYISKLNEGFHFFDVLIMPLNENVKSSYITNTLFSVENKGLTPVKYDVSIQVETTNVVSFTSSVSASSGASVAIKKVKAEASSKANIEYSTKTTTSVKEKKSLVLEVEAGSRAIIYLMGDITITNGVFSVHEFFFNVAKGGYEFAVLNNQYTRIEKDVIWQES